MSPVNGCLHLVKRRNNVDRSSITPNGSIFNRTSNFGQCLVEAWAFLQFDESSSEIVEEAGSAGNTLVHYSELLPSIKKRPEETQEEPLVKFPSEFFHLWNIEVGWLSLLAETS